ncbi:MAG: helix-turn-helix transcriptional regulator [Verrucomicrobiales bacterium]
MNARKNNNMTLGERIKLERERCGFTLQGLTDSLNEDGEGGDDVLTWQRIQHIEAGRTKKVSDPFRKRIAKAMGLPEDVFLEIETAGQMDRALPLLPDCVAAELSNNPRGNVTLLVDEWDWHPDRIGTILAITYLSLVRRATNTKDSPMTTVVLSGSLAGVPSLPAWMVMLHCALMPNSVKPLDPKEDELRDAILKVTKAVTRRGLEDSCLEPTEEDLSKWLGAQLRVFETEEGQLPTGPGTVCTVSRPDGDDFVCLILDADDCVEIPAVRAARFSRSLPVGWTGCRLRAHSHERTLKEIEFYLHSHATDLR